MIEFKFDSKKANEVILYIASHLKVRTDIRIVQILYFADKLHLEKYGRLICGGKYIATEYYGIINKNFSNATYNIPIGKDKLCKANLDYLSESDIECLNKVLEVYKCMSLQDFQNMCYNDEVYKKVYKGKTIDVPIERIIETFKDSEDLLEHLTGA